MRDADANYERDMEAAEREAAAHGAQWELEQQELEREADEQYQRDMEAADREAAAIEREIQAEEAARFRRHRSAGAPTKWMAM